MPARSFLRSNSPIALIKGKPTPFTFIKFFMPDELFLYLGGGDSRTYSIAQIHK
jgi:hypothetical protein